MNMVRCAKSEHKRHLNQLRHRFTEDVTAQEEIKVVVLYDMFDITTLTREMVVPRLTSKRKRKRGEPWSPDPKRKKKSISEENNLEEDVLFWNLQTGR